MRFQLALSLIAATLLVPVAAHAQHAITGARTTIDFNTYAGAGLQPTPVAGQLDTGDWVISGFSDLDPDGMTPFDPTAATNATDSYLTGDLARGVSTGGVTTGGLYAFTVASSDRAFGWQAGSNDVTPGTFTLALVNSTIADITDPTIRYEAWVLNNANRGNNLTFSWSTDGTTFTAVPALDVVSPDAADTTPVWVATPEQTTLTGTTIPVDGALFLRWTTDDVSGVDTRDELAIDDITVLTPGCGDGVFQAAEACDDGDNDDGDGCSATCTVEHGFACDVTFPSVCASDCGDSLVASDEECDDGGIAIDDGCSATCTEETGWTCDAAEPSVCTTTCGDGVMAGAEACDDSNTVDETACAYGTPTCTGCQDDCLLVLDLVGPFCGDALVTDAEACDDDGTVDDDGCSATCTVEHGFDCGTDEPSVCASDCGDGLIASDEVCDDTNTTAGDGCSDLCVQEADWACVGEPSVCTSTVVNDCGNGALDGVEQCDDGDMTADDGCDDACMVETGFVCDGEPSTCQADADEDGHADADDNCPDDANPSQADDDDDGVGNVCDDPTEPGTADGCCSTGDQGQAGWLLLGLGVVVALRRRRRA